MVKATLNRLLHKVGCGTAKVSTVQESGDGLATDGERSGSSPAESKGGMAGEVTSPRPLVVGSYPTPLIEGGRPVALHFHGRDIPARRDPESGYVGFDLPDDAALAAYYRHEYGQESTDYYTIEANWATGKDHVGAIQDAAARLGITDLAGLRIHELGCAYGGVVAALLAVGARATGSDLSARAVAEGNARLDSDALICAAHGNALASLTEPCNLIYASHTLEHDPHLDQTLRAAADALDVDGALIAWVPNAVYLRAILDGFTSNPWVAYPDHLHMLSAGSLGRLADRAGLHPAAMWTKTFEDGPELARHFGPTWDEPATRARWRWLLGRLGLGWELCFVLTRNPTPETAAVRAEIERQARFEVELRNLMEKT